jgi:hypothetical protein
MSFFPTLAEKQRIAALLNTTTDEISSSYVRSSTYLGNTSSLRLAVNAADKNPQYATDALLAQNDVFCVTHIAFGLSKVGAAIGSVTDALMGLALLYRYVNRAAGIFDGTNDANLQLIYNGILSITVNNSKIIPKLDMFCFERVPDAQQGNINAAIAGPVTYTQQRDGNPNGLFGYFPVDPFTIAGTGKNDFVVTLPTGANMVESNESNFLTLQLKGFVASNAN